MNASLKHTLVTLAVTVFVVPAAFLAVPAPAHAAGMGCVGGILGGLFSSSLGGLVSVPVNSTAANTINAQTAGVTTGTCINELIVVPAVRAAIKTSLQKMTSSVLGWISGNNPSGKPGFVVNLAAHLQGLGDATALPIIVQASTAFNSPFGPAISTSLGRAYAQQTSMSGFYAANRCTLNVSSRNPDRFLAGDWSQGGVGAWMALTTQPQNNPYTLYQTAQTQVGANVTAAAQNRRQEISQSNGFLSWCGKASVKKASTRIGINIGDACTDANGVAAAIQTPGIVLTHYLQRATGVGFDQQLALLSSTDGNIDAALQLVMENVFMQAFNDDENGGLAGASTPIQSRPALVEQLGRYVPDTANAAGTASSTAQTMIDRVATFLSVIGTIKTAADTASTSVAKLSFECASSTASTQRKLDEFIARHPNDTSSTTQAAIKYLQDFIKMAGDIRVAADTALTNDIKPELERVSTAASAATRTRDAALQVQAEAKLSPQPASLANDVANLTTRQPSAVDVTEAQSAAAVTGGARTPSCKPEAMLKVSGGTTVDKMNLLDKNAKALLPACNPVVTTTTIKCDSATVDPTPTTVGGGGGGGGGDGGFWSLVLTIIAYVVAL